MTDDSPRPGGESVPPGVIRTVDRAISRLNLLEWVILAGAAAMAILGGALAGFILQELLGAPFRIVWIVGALLLFAVPGWAVLIRGNS